MSRKNREIDAEEFREHLFTLIEEVNESGGTIVVTRDGEALVRVTPAGSIPSLRGSFLQDRDLVSTVARTGQSVAITDDGRPGSELAVHNSPATLFGALAGRVRILGDIISPLDLEWDAQK